MFDKLALELSALTKLVDKPVAAVSRTSSGGLRRGIAALSRRLSDLDQRNAAPMPIVVSTLAAASNLHF
ncbi:MAG: hypothetical protein IPG52_12280 [Rhodocyclaceae bacterium]|nr:hypothetical protein [Rhodocyclaceae bacterium]